jgi:hypothetical protein
LQADCHALAAKLPAAEAALEAAVCDAKAARAQEHAAQRALQLATSTASAAVVQLEKTQVGGMLLR